MIVAINKQVEAVKNHTGAVEKQTSAIEVQTAVQKNYTQNFCDAMKDQNRFLKRIAEALGQGLWVLGTDACWDHNLRYFNRMWYGGAPPLNPRH